MNYNLIKVIFSLFKKKSGYTFTNFLNKVRVEKSKKYILKKDLSILDVAVLIGFNSQNYYSIIFKKFNLGSCKYKKSPDESPGLCLQPEVPYF
ncbi:helix-turn-helix domain-containing protein [Clostridioides difficile]|uniref:helix-turn-helix domain-containing protein n=5 Tax=Clostridioides difficile TaxID=1496 RepID=UPI000BD7341E|nr:AraC family transcriptional regulator [Clostridioides difficile]